MCKEIQINIKKYERFENLNFLNVKTNHNTTTKTVHSSAYQTHLSNGSIHDQINNQIYKTKRICGKYFDIFLIIMFQRKDKTKMYIINF